MTLFHYVSNIAKNLQYEVQKLFSWLLKEKDKRYILAKANLLNGG